jgi:putative FmdB family regulatory protein
MPIYEYACKACGHEFEELQTVTEGGTAKCPICGAAAERRISVPQRAIIRENATKPAEKGKAQIEKELGEQVNSGELPAELAAQQAKMANL